MLLLHTQGDWKTPLITPLGNTEVENQGGGGEKRKQRRAHDKKLALRRRWINEQRVFPSHHKRGG